MDFGTFSERAMDFSEGDFGSFGGFVLILFRVSDGNPSAIVFLPMVLQVLQNYASPGSYTKIHSRILRFSSPTSIRSTLVGYYTLRRELPLNFSWQRPSKIRRIGRHDFCGASTACGTRAAG